jgi:ankyrin repeat protein
MKNCSVWMEKRNYIMSLINSNQKSRPIYFWRGAVDPKKIIKNENVKQKVLELLQNTFPSGDLEKLKGSNIYSLRTSIKSRLLFTNIQLDEKKHILLLDHLENHEYDKCKYLTRSVFKKFLASQESYLEIKPQDYVWENTDDFDNREWEKSEKPSDNLTNSCLPLELYGKKFIKLSDTQQSVLECQTPLIVNGAPGSGKSCVALSAIVNYLTDPSNQNGKKILYVGSPRLVIMMKKYWLKFPLSQEKTITSKVHFKTYMDLLWESVDVESNDYREAQEGDITDWYKRQCKISGKSQNSDSTIKINDENRALIFQEFQILSGCTDINSYKNLGRKETFFYKKLEKEQILKLYENYSNFLKKNDLLDPRFHKKSKLPLVENFFDLTVVDEAIDLSDLAILRLCKSTQNNNIVYFLDTHQNLHGCISKRINFKRVLKSNGYDINTIDLQHVYRCPKRVVEVANRCLDIKMCITCGIADKDEYREIQLSTVNTDNQGLVEWHDKNFLEVYNNLQTLYKKTEIAIITTQEVKELKGGDFSLIFTPEEIKGLEFPCILIYKPFDTQEFRSIAKKLEHVEADDLKRHRNRPKQVKAMDGDTAITLIPELNKFFTSLTRSENSLIIFQPKDPRVENIFRLLLPSSAPVMNTDKTITKPIIETTEEDWIAIAKEMYEKGNKQKFAEICKNRLSKEPEEMAIKLGLTNSAKMFPSPSIKKSTKQKKSPELKPIGQGVSSQFKGPYKKGTLQEIDNLLTFFTDDKVGEFLKRKNREYLLFDVLDQLNTSLIQKIKKSPQKIKIFKKQLLQIDLFQVEAQNEIRILKLISTLCLVELKKTQLQFLTFFRVVSAVGDREIVQLLIEKGADVNKTWKDGVTPLWVASQNGHEEVVKLLIANGADVKKSNENGVTPLWVASQNGHKGTVKLLIEKGADVHKANENGVTPLWIASQNGHEGTVELLIEKGADVKKSNENGVTPLWIASQNDHEGTVELLIEKGADVKKSNENGVTPLWIASEYGHEGTVELLIEKGADVNKANENGVCPLWIASQYGHEKVVKLLIANYADVKKACKDGISPLWVAAENGHEGTVNLLIASSADVNKAGKGGVPPLLIASQNGHEKVVNLLIANGADVKKADKNGVPPLWIASQNGHEKVVKLLIANGADVKKADKNGVPPLWIASQNGHEGTVELLIEKGADVKKSNENDVTPLCIASEYGHEGTVELLIEKGADVNKAGKGGVTPLWIASEYGHEGTVKLLIANGADVNKAGKGGVTPLWIASEYGHEGTVKLLIANGADVNKAGEDGVTPLCIASQNGHKEIVQHLLDGDADVNSKVNSFCERCGYTPLHFAIEGGLDEISNLLIRKKADYNAAAKNGITPLMIKQKINKI